MHTSYGGYERKQETSGKVISHPVVNIVKFCPVEISKKSFSFFLQKYFYLFENLFWDFLKIFGKSQKIFCIASQKFFDSNIFWQKFRKNFRLCINKYKNLNLLRRTLFYVLIVVFYITLQVFLVVHDSYKKYCVFNFFQVFL